MEEMFEYSRVTTCATAACEPAAMTLIIHQDSEQDSFRMVDVYQGVAPIRRFSNSDDGKELEQSTSES